MARHKDKDWFLPEGTPNGEGDMTHSWNSIHTALLMDIRDELKETNSIARRVEQTVARIDRRVRKHMPLK